MRALLARSLAAALLVVAACTQATGRPAPSTDRTVLTQEQIAERHFNNVYDAVAELRSNWLLTRGPDSFNSPSEVKVYLDNTMLGGVETLKQIQASTITYVRHFDGPTATSRWGIGHGAGVIYVSTRPMAGDPDE